MHLAVHGVGALPPDIEGLFPYTVPSAARPGRIRVRRRNPVYQNTVLLSEPTWPKRPFLSGSIRTTKLSTLKRAAKAAGMQLGCFVEQIVLEKLDGSELERMSDDLDALRREIEGLREELARWRQRRPSS
jgi:hypothetical protein